MQHLYSWKKHSQRRWRAALTVPVPAGRRRRELRGRRAVDKPLDLPRRSVHELRGIHDRVARIRRRRRALRSQDELCEGVRVAAGEARLLHDVPNDGRLFGAAHHKDNIARRENERQRKCNAVLQKINTLKVRDENECVAKNDKREKQRAYRCGGGFGESRIGAISLTLSASSACAGKSEAVCPSGPMPRNTASNSGMEPDGCANKALISPSYDSAAASTETASAPRLSFRTWRWSPMAICMRMDLQYD
jgi:hypothetical protein